MSIIEMKATEKYFPVVLIRSLRSFNLTLRTKLDRIPKLNICSKKF